MSLIRLPTTASNRHQQVFYLYVVQTLIFFLFDSHRKNTMRGQRQKKIPQRFQPDPLAMQNHQQNDAPAEPLRALAPDVPVPAQELQDDDDDSVQARHPMADQFTAAITQFTRVLSTNRSDPTKSSPNKNCRQSSCLGQRSTAAVVSSQLELRLFSQTLHTLS
jgi:hypothetical protein